MPGHAKSYIGNSVKGSFEEFGLRIVSRSGLAKIQGMVIAVVIVIAAFAAYYMAMPTPPTTPPKVTTTAAATEVIPDDIAAIVKQLPTYYPKDYWKTIAAAKQEGKLVIYHSLSLDEFNPIMKGFQEFYPFVKVEAIRLSSEKVYDKYNAEMTALGRTACDALRADASGYLGLVKRGELMYYVTPEQPYMPKGQYIEGYIYPDSSYTYGVQFDKTKLPPEKVPKGVEDMIGKVKADSEYWKGKIYVYDPRFSISGWTKYYALRKTVGKEKSLEWYKTLVDNKCILTTSGTVGGDKILAGEALAFFDASMSNWAASRWGERNLVNLDLKVWEDYPILVLRVNWALPKNGGGHPNAARLWIDFILSMRGQSVIANYALSVRTDYLEKAKRTPLMDWYDQAVVKAGLEKKLIYDSIFPEDNMLHIMTVKEEWVRDWEKAMGF